MRQCSRETPVCVMRCSGGGDVSWCGLHCGLVFRDNNWVVPDPLPRAKETIYPRLRNLKSVGPSADQPLTLLLRGFLLLSHMTTLSRTSRAMLTGIVRKNGKMLVTLRSPVTGGFTLSLSVGLSRCQPIEVSDMTSRWCTWTNHWSCPMLICFRNSSSPRGIRWERLGWKPGYPTKSAQRSPTTPKHPPAGIPRNRDGSRIWDKRVKLPQSGRRVLGGPWRGEHNGASSGPGLH